MRVTRRSHQNRLHRAAAAEGGRALGCVFEVVDSGVPTTFIIKKEIHYRTIAVEEIHLEGRSSDDANTMVLRTPLI